jgi:hypothetical protein
VTFQPLPHYITAKIACPFALICELLQHPPYTNFVILEVLMDDGVCRSQLMSNLLAVSLTLFSLSLSPLDPEH